MKANYTDHPLPELNTNILTRALPKIRDDTSVLSAFHTEPQFHISEIHLPSHLREMATHRLNQFRFPLDQYLGFFRAIEMGLFDSFRVRDPFSPSTSHYLHNLNYHESELVPRTGRLIPNGACITVIGESGSGKSTMVDAVLEQFPQTIHHSISDEESYSLTQLVWIKIECPTECSVIEFCKCILREIDTCLGTHHIGDLNSRSGESDYKTKVEMAARSEFMGVIVIEEMHRLAGKNGGNSEKLIRFIVRLINISGFVAVFVGTPQVQSFLSGSLHTARRCEAGGVFVLDSMEPTLWNLFFKRMSSFLWTKNSEIEPGVIEAAYSLCAGLPSAAVKNFIATQKLAIQSETERVTLDCFRDATRDASRFSNDYMIDLALKQGASKNTDTDKALRTKPIPSMGHIENSIDGNLIDRFLHDEFSHIEFGTNLTRDGHKLIDSLDEDDQMQYLERIGVTLPLSQICSSFTD